MKKRRIIYSIVTIIYILLSIMILFKINFKNNVDLSKAIQIILILFLIRISIGCTLYIKKQYEKQKYSYSIIMNLGLLIFININILRQINLLIQNWKVLNIIDIYQNTLKSFSYFAMLTLPCIIILSIYSIISNIILIKKEGFHPNKVLGIVMGFFSLIGLFLTQCVYLFLNNIITGATLNYIKYTLDVCINASISYLYTLILATLYCNVKAAKHIPKYDKDYIIILGCKVMSNGNLTPLLKGRVDKAIEFGKKQYEENNKKIIYIPSGGQGEDEITSEAEAMQKYLVKQGIKNNQIIMENRSSNIYENIKYSKEIIDNKNRKAKICFSTTNYHVFRSGIIANEQGLDCEGMGSKTKWYFYTNALIREFIANLVQERKKHIILLLLINISLILLIVIGKQNHLIFITN